MVGPLVASPQYHVGLFYHKIIMSVRWHKFGSRILISVQGFKTRSITRDHRVSQGITEYHKVSQGITEYHKVSQSITRYHKVWVVSWCCGSPNDVTFRPFCVSHYHKVQVFIQPLQILFSANECKMSVGLSVPTNSLTNFDLIKQGFN